MQTIKNKKKIVIFVVGIAIGLSVFVASFLSMKNDKTDSVQKLLDMGQRYIDELDYDQAIVCYEKIISIDESCVEAYLGAAQAYILLGDNEAAKEILEKGYSLVEDNRIQEMLNLLQSGNVNGVNYNNTSKINDVRFEERIVDGIYHHGYEYYDLTENEENFLEKIIDLAEKEKVDEVYAILESEEIGEFFKKHTENDSQDRIHIAFNDYKVLLVWWKKEEYYSEGCKISIIPLEKKNGYIYDIYKTEFYVDKSYINSECKDGMFNGVFRKEDIDINNNGDVTRRFVAGNVVNGLLDGEIKTQSIDYYSDGYESEYNYINFYNKGKPQVIEVEYDEEFKHYNIYNGYCVDSNGNHLWLVVSCALATEEEVNVILFDISESYAFSTVSFNPYAYDENGNWVQGRGAYDY